MKIDQYCQRQRCKHVKLEQFLACFHVTQVCQHWSALGGLVCLWCIIDAMLHTAVSYCWWSLELTGSPLLSCNATVRRHKGMTSWPREADGSDRLTRLGRVYFWQLMSQWLNVINIGFRQRWNDVEGHSKASAIWILSGAHINKLKKLKQW